MPRQFAYQDAHGVIYPAHATLAFQPGLVPGWYDTDTRVFTPTGNPLAQTGPIVTEAGTGVAPEQVVSGLQADTGADTAPLHGVAVTAPENTEVSDTRAPDVPAQAPADATSSEPTTTSLLTHAVRRVRKAPE